MTASRIEWTDEVWMIDRDGRRVRTYRRADPTRPGQQERRARANIGQRWCRDCREWLPADEVARGGRCRPHVAADYRRRYAADPDRVRQRVYARRRSIAPVPFIAVETLRENFGDRCAYCMGAATTWDHVIPVSRGGDTTPGNVAPACLSCNASKKARDVEEWLIETGRRPHPAFVDLLSLGEVVAA